MHIAEGDPEATASFRALAGRVLDALLEGSPDMATALGDHRFDDRMEDLGADGVAHRCAGLSEALGALDQVDDTRLSADDRVDLELLRTWVARTSWELSEVRAHETNPLLHLPGEALHPLVTRPAPDPADRVRCVVARLSEVPHRLAVAREVLRDMPRVQVETAIGQARGVVDLLGDDLDALVAQVPGAAREVDAARQDAAEALESYAQWLHARLVDSDGDPRLGPQRFAARLWYALDTETSPDALLTRAESDLQAVEEEIAEVAAAMDGGRRRTGQVREVLDRLAAQAPVDDATLFPLCREALELLTTRVHDLELVTVPEQPVHFEVMAPARRGVTVAYCHPPGPLEPAVTSSQGLQPSVISVAPPPADWSPSKVASFYREYNGHMVRNLLAHEAVPGHVLQLAHAGSRAAALADGGRVRAAAWSGTFVEGWAVYAEALMAQVGLGREPEDDLALRMQQLKMQLRTTINAVLDVRVHAHGMTREEALRLMILRGHQEEGEAEGKWRRALLTSAQLSTYYVGYHEITAVLRDLRAARPELSRREAHDAVLAHGCPPPRHLRTLLSLPERG